MTTEEQPAAEVPDATASFAAHAEACFPALQQVASSEVKGGIVAALRQFLAAGGWTRLEDAPYDDEFPQWNLVKHLNQSTALALAMAEVLGQVYPDEHLDRDAVIAAGTLFDADKFSSDRNGAGPLGLLPHALWGAQVAMSSGLDDQVGHAIAAHTPQNRVLPTGVLALLIAYADYIDFDVVRATRRGSLIARLLRRGASSLAFDWV
jgi:hypothetical protein